MGLTAILEESVHLINIIAVDEGGKGSIWRIDWRFPMHSAELRAAADEPQEAGRRKKLGGSRVHDR